MKHTYIMSSPTTKVNTHFYFLFVISKAGNSLAGIFANTEKISVRIGGAIDIDRISFGRNFTWNWNLIIFLLLLLLLFGTYEVIVDNGNVTRRYSSISCKESKSLQYIYTFFGCLDVISCFFLGDWNSVSAFWDNTLTLSTGNNTYSMDV